MRKGLVAIGATVLAVLAPAGVSSATHQENGNQGSPRDFVVGGGTIGSNNGTIFGATQVAFGAQGGPTMVDRSQDPEVIFGDPVTGHFRSGGELLDPQGGTNPTEFQLEGPVTCLNVKGNEARLIYPVKRGSSELMEQSEIFIFLKDNRKPGEADRPKDTVGFKILEDETPEDDPPSERDGECDTDDMGATSNLEKGDITVHEAIPEEDSP
jgi:hypothetical protein